MDTLFSTSSVHPRDRFDYWHSEICRALLYHDSTPENAGTFRAEIKTGSLADIGLVLFEHSPVSFRFTADHAARADPDFVFLCRLMAGGATLAQDDREVVLEPGDVTLIDSHLPYAGCTSGDASMLVLKIPRRLLETRVGKLSDLAFRGIKPASTDSRLTSALLAMLPAHTQGLTPASEDVLKTKTLDLIALALAPLEGGGPNRSSARLLVLMKVRAAIEARLADPDLDAEKVVAAAGVSKRRANAVLAEEGLSVSRLIHMRRLARCRSAFDDPRQINRTVSEIAYGWGFSDMTHFGRSFRAAFGLLPGDYRKALRHEI